MHEIIENQGCIFVIVSYIVLIGILEKKKHKLLLMTALCDLQTKQWWRRPGSPDNCARTKYIYLGMMKP